MADLSRNLEGSSSAREHRRSTSRRFFLFWHVTTGSLLTRKSVKDKQHSRKNRPRTANRQADYAGVHGFKTRHSRRDRAEYGTKGSNDLTRSVAISWDLSGHTVQILEPRQDSRFQARQPLAFQEGPLGSLDGEKERATAGLETEAGCKEHGESQRIDMERCVRCRF